MSTAGPYNYSYIFKYIIIGEALLGVGACMTDYIPTRVESYACLTRALPPDLTATSTVTMYIVC